MSYAFVQDVPATWDTYRGIAETLSADCPEGLVVHAAGPTDEGFRMIGIWESRETWDRFRDEQQPGQIDGSLDAQLSRSTLRDLEVHDLYLTSSNLPLKRTT